ncbi:MAG: hypothetical protein U1A24_03085 [Cypionkella sp.]|uniref:hypothetical protein n=1 Tax=Cypionkella sp. TaxID=2811411 RepID=UPI002AB98B33|nr:hypothetical protein [Cypionkella sp.]MDZ4309531.1 hypothetical protein [Cypionkella sp.]
MKAKFLAILVNPNRLAPILKEVVAACAKKQRKTAIEVLLSFYGKREPISALLAKGIPKDRFAAQQMKQLSCSAAVQLKHPRPKSSASGSATLSHETEGISNERSDYTVPHHGHCRPRRQ